MREKEFLKWEEIYKNKKDFCTNKREPFFFLAAKYLPSDKNAIILDIGTGDAKFIDLSQINKNYKSIYLLDGNENNIVKLKKKYKNTILYKAPNPLPFEDNFADYIHCSHLIEHLYFEDLYLFLKELDRILKNNGIIIISTPLNWKGFYDNLSHIKPYNPSIIYNYFCSNNKTRSFSIISNNYTLVKLVYRYTTPSSIDEGWGSNKSTLDFFIQLIKQFLFKLGIRKYIKTGYTIILRKNFY